MSSLLTAVGGPAGLTGAVATATAWRSVGGQRFTPLIQEMSDVAVDAVGRVYVAFSDASKSNRATVMTYRDGAWTTVGPAGFSSGYAYGIALALDPSGAPWVAFYDNDVLAMTCVMRWLNNRWVYVGTPGFPAAGATYYHQLAFDAGGTPYVAYREQTQAYKATVQRFTNGVWVPVGAVGVTGGQADYLRLAVDASTGIPYIAFRDNALSSYLSVMRFDGGAWAYVGVRGFTTPSAVDYVGLAVRDGSPVVSYRDSASNKLNVQRWDATASAWTSLSTPPLLTLPPLTTSDTWWKDLERATDASTSQIVYSVPLDLLENTAWKAFVVGRAGWVRTDALGRSCACVSYYLYAGAYATDVTAVSAFTALTFVARGATTANDSTNARTSVLAFLSGRWVTLTDPRLGCDYNSVRIASDGAPVVAFRDTTRGNMVRVAVFRSGTWTVLSDAMGVSTFMSLASPSAVSLALTSADVPVIAIMDTTRVSVVTIDEADGSGPVTPAAVRLECRTAGSNTVTFSGLAGVTDARGATTSVRVSVGTESTRSTEKGFSSSMLARVAVPAGASEAQLRLSTASLGTTDLVYGWVDATDDRGNVTRSGPFPAPLAGMWVSDRAFRGLAAAQSASASTPYAVEVSAGWLMSPPASQPAQAVLVVSDAPLSSTRAAYVAAQFPSSGASVQELAAATAATSATCWTAFPMAGLRASSVWRESDARASVLQDFVGIYSDWDMDVMLQTAAVTGLWSALSESQVAKLYAYLVSTAPGGAAVASAALNVQLRDVTPPVLTGVAVAQATGGQLSVAVTAGSVSDGGRPGRLTAFLVLARSAMSTQALSAIPNLLFAAPAGSVLAESGYAGYGAALQLGGKLSAAQFWTGSAFAVLDDSKQTTLVPHVFAVDAAGNAASVALAALSLRDATGPRLESLAFAQSATDYRVSATAGTVMEARTDGAVAAYVVLASAPKSAAELQALNGGYLAGALETGAWQALPSATSAGSLAPLHGGPALPYPPVAMSSDAQTLTGLRYGTGVYSLSTNKPLRYGRLSNLTNGRTGGAVANDDATWAADLVGVDSQEGVACTWTVTLRLPSAINVTRYTLGAPLALPAGGPQSWRVLFYTDQTSTTASFTDTRTGVLPATWATGALQDFALSSTASGVVRAVLAIDLPNAGSGSRVLLSHFRLWAAAGVSTTYVDRLPAMTAGLMTDNTGTVVYPRVNANWTYAGSDGVYTVTASGEADAPRTAWRMFNKSLMYDSNWTDDTWASSVLPAWAQVRLPALQVVTSFVLATPALAALPEVPVARLPKAYSFIGVSDAGVETVLYSTAAEAAPALSGTEYQIAVSFTNAVAYRSYKLSVTACQSGGYLQIGELRLYGSSAASVVTVPLLGATASSEDPTDDSRRATKLLDDDLSATSAWYSATGVSTASVTLKASALCAPTQAVLYSAASNAVFGGASTLARSAAAWGVNSDGSEVLLGASSNLGYAAYSGGTANGRQWPPAGLTFTGGTLTDLSNACTVSGQAYGNGTYTVSVSSVLNQSTRDWRGFHAFDRRAGGHGDNADSSWHNDTTNPATTPQFIDIQMPSAVTVGTMAIWVISQDLTTNQRQPLTFLLYGHNNNIAAKVQLGSWTLTGASYTQYSWAQVSSDSYWNGGLDNTGVEASQFYTKWSSTAGDISTAAAYTNFRLHVTSASGTGGITVMEWALFEALSASAATTTAVLSAALPLAYPLTTSLFSSFRLQVAADGGEAAGRVNLTGVQLQCAASPAPALTCTRYLDVATGAFSNITQTAPTLYPHVIATDAASNTSLALLSALTVADRSGPLLSGVSVAQGASNYTYTVLGGSASDAKSGGNLKAYLVPSATAMTAAQLYAVNTNNLDGVIESSARLALSNYVAGSNASLAGLSCTKYLNSGGTFVSVSDLFPAAYDPASGAAVRLAFENPLSLGDNLGSGGVVTVGVSYLRQWPPAALTADSCWLTGQPYGSGAYFATASSSNAANPAFGAFDAGAASWQSASNVVSGVTLSLELPAPIKLHSFVLLTGAGATATAPAFGPKAFVVYGVSSTGVDTALLTVATQTYSARPGLATNNNNNVDISTTGVVSVAASVAYSKFKIVVGSTYSGAGCVEVVDWTLFESATDLAAPTGPDNAGYGDLVVLSTAADDSGAAGMSVGTYLAGTTVTLRNVAGVALRTDVCANANSILTYSAVELGAGYTITGGGKPLAGNHSAGNAAASTNVTSALYYFSALRTSGPATKVVVYCPTADVSVSVGFGAANDGTFAGQTFTGSGSARTAIAVTLSASPGYYRLTASAPVCAMVYSGTFDFLTLLPPAATLLGYDFGTASGLVPPVVGATTATNGLAKVFKASSATSLSYATNSGACACAAPLTALADTYMVPHVVAGDGYSIIAVKPTVVSVYAVSSATGATTLVATHALSTASETVPGIAVASAVAGGTWGAYFVGTAPFALRLDNGQANEYVALGVMSPAAATVAYGSAATGAVAGRYGYGIARTSGTLYSGSIAAPTASVTAGWSAAYWLKVDAALWTRAAAASNNLYMFDELPGALSATFGPSGLVHGLVSSTRVKRAQAPITAAKLSSGSWRHVAVTVAGEGSSARVKQYVDGSLWYSCTDAITTAASYSSLALTLASAAARPLALDLALDDLRVYARALTDAEVLGLYGAASGSNASGGGFPLYLNVLAVDNSSNLTLLQPAAADVRDQTVPTVSGLTVTQSGTDYKFTAGAGSVAEGRPGSLAAYLVMSTAALSTAQLASMRASGSLDSGLDATAKLFNSSYAGSSAAVALNTLYTYRYWDATASAFAVLADGIAATLYPHAAVFDAAGNAASQQLAAVVVVDRTPPSVSGLAVAQGASNYTYTVTAGLTRDDRSSNAFKVYFFMGNAQNMTATTAAALDAALIETSSNGVSANAKLSFSNYVAGSNVSLAGLSCTKYWNGTAFLTTTETAPFPTAVLYPHVLAVDGSAAANATWSWLPAVNIADRNAPALTGGAASNNNAADYRVTLTAGSASDGRAGLLNAYLVLGTSALSTAQMVSMRASGDLDSNLEATAKYANAAYAGSNVAQSLAGVMWSSKYWSGSAFATLGEADVGRSIYPNLLLTDAAGNAAAQQLPAITVADRTGPSIGGLAVAQSSSNYTYTLTAGTSSDLKSAGAFRAYFFMGNSSNMTATTAAALDTAVIEPAAKLSLSNYVAGSNVSLSGMSCTKYWNGSSFTVIAEIIPALPFTLYPHVLAVDGSPGANPTTSWLPAVTVADRTAPTIAATTVTQSTTDYKCSVTAGSVTDARAGPLTSYLVMASAALSTANLASLWALSNLDAAIETSARLAQPSYAAGSSTALTSLYAYQFWHAGSNAFQAIGELSPALYPHVLAVDAGSNASSTQLAAITLVDKTPPTLSGLAVTQGASNYTYTVSAGGVVEYKSAGNLKAYLISATAPMTAAQLYAIPTLDTSIEATAKYTTAAYVAGSNVSLVGLSSTKYVSGGVFTAISETVPGTPFQLYHHLLAVDNVANLSSVMLPVVTVADRSVPAFSVAAVVSQSATDYKYSLTAGTVADGRPGSLYAYLVMALSSMTAAQLLALRSTLDASLEASAKYSTGSYTAASALNLGGVGMYAYTYWNGTSFAPIAEPTGALYPHLLVVDGAGNPVLSAAASTTPADRTGPTIASFSATMSASTLAVPATPALVSSLTEAALGTVVTGMTGPVNGVYSFSNCQYQSSITNAAYSNLTYILIARSDRTRASDFSAAASKSLTVERRDATQQVGLAMSLTETDYNVGAQSSQYTLDGVSTVVPYTGLNSSFQAYCWRQTAPGNVVNKVAVDLIAADGSVRYHGDDSNISNTVPGTYHNLVVAANNCVLYTFGAHNRYTAYMADVDLVSVCKYLIATANRVAFDYSVYGTTVLSEARTAGWIKAYLMLSASAMTGAQLTAISNLDSVVEGTSRYAASNYATGSNVSLSGLVATRYWSAASNAFLSVGATSPVNGVLYASLLALDNNNNYTACNLPALAVPDRQAPAIQLFSVDQGASDYTFAASAGTLSDNRPGGISAFMVLASSSNLTSTDLSGIIGL